MKQFLLPISISIISLLSSGDIVAGDSGVRFAVNSPLAEGQWVKIGVDTNGIYEISHDMLLSMGFSDPEKVGVYGRGGKALNLNFYDNTGNPLYSDELTPVAVLHHAGKLYFYGEGSRSFKLNRSSKSGADGWFSRLSRNIYTDYGCYFLSDTQDPLLMEEADIPYDPERPELSYAYSMVSHEEDLHHNNTNSGQIFFGESIGADDTTRMEWPLILNGALPQSTGVMECAYYFDTDASGEWSFGTTTDSEAKTYQINKVNTSNLRRVNPLYADITVPGEETTLFVEVTPEETVPEVANLDYWTLTYRRGLPTLRDTSGSSLNQETIGFPQLAPAIPTTLRIPGGADFMAIDVTDVSNPKRLKITPEGLDGIATLRATEDAPVLTIFDPLRPQLQIKGFTTGYTRIVNQNLHAAAAEGADLVIICVPTLRQTAEKIARIHEELDGIRCIIATTEECYNEFSMGIPDPMAYRALVKNVYTSPNPCRNVLLLGPLFSDFRGVITPRPDTEGIIAFQSPLVSQMRGAANANDFYGMMGDYINTTDLHVNNMEVGVGLLPIRYPDEARYATEKIERYLKAEDIELYLNAFTHIGGVGDRHTHDGQAIQLSSLIDRMSDYSNVNTILPVDAYGYKGAQDKFFSDLYEGRLLVNYFGHGSTGMLNQKGNFFMASDVYRLRNRYLPFIAFAGCSLSNPDRGQRGLGESLVVSTPYGAIGSLLATRETWSGENGEMFDVFYSNMFREGRTTSSPRHKRDLTIGELVARTKSSVSSNNELAYQLICDPAIVLPVTTRLLQFNSVSQNFPVGERLTIEGYVAKPDGDGEIDPDFNGKVVARLLEPVRTVISPDLCSGESDVELRFQITDSQMAVATGEVVNGQFSFDIYIPQDARQYIGQPSRLHVAAYSPELRTAGGGLVTGIIREPADGTPAEDTTPPMIEHIWFDADNLELHVRVSDDIAPAMTDHALEPAFSLLVDGREEARARHTMSVPDPNGRAYEKRILLPDISFGRHTAKVSVLDAAGNRASAETIFTYLPGGADLAIELDAVALGNSVFIRPMTPMPEEVEFAVLDTDGNEVCRLAYPEHGLEWDGTDNSGKRLAPGLYKGYVIQTGGAIRKSHSDLIDIPVIAY